jgi:hypothetical protein
MFYVLVIVVTTIILGYNGYSYYSLPVEDRFFHPEYANLKPSGYIGLWLGIVGSIFVLIGIFSYMARKRMHIFSRMGVLKYWLEFHIFLCTLGSVLILFHTSFKFGGIVAISFWSMVAVVASGFVESFIYQQIPRTIEGRELSLQEADDMKDELVTELKTKHNIDISELQMGKYSQVESKLKAMHLPVLERLKIKSLINKQKRLVKRIAHLDTMQGILKYWHVVHLPFALVMLIVMTMHIGIVLSFSMKWIF